LQFARADETRIRRRFISGALDAFEPDIIIVENRPLGMSDELEGLLEENDAKKVFLTRDIMCDPSSVRDSYLSKDQQRALIEIFDKIIVAGDRKVWDLTIEYELCSEIAEKIDYVGYISEAINSQDIERIRAERQIPENSVWIVCSGGGGIHAEKLVQKFTSLAPTLSEAVVDIVQGPHSTFPWTSFCNSTSVGSNGYLHRECHALPLLHAAADVVICPGGYNSIVEAMVGGARIIGMCVHPPSHGEQSLRLSRLARYYPIFSISQVEELRGALDHVLARRDPKTPIQESSVLDFNGACNAADRILATFQ
jgi:predicted glycosyltransferase